MVKDAYSMLHVQDTLDVLNGAVYFTLLNLKSTYWQVEMDETSKAFTAFTICPLGFYECECMAFGLISVPATF